MASFIWNRDAQEALDHPYEYNAQMQFHREAIKLSDFLLGKILEKKSFTLTEVSLEKATWMLQTDAIYAFKEGVEVLETKKHRLVGRLLRDILETVHLVEYFNSGLPSAANSLKKWFSNELVMHKEFREFIEKRDGKSEADRQRDLHRIFSKFTHRSYKTLLYGYFLADNDQIYLDHKWTLASTVSMCYAFLGHFGTSIVENLKMYGLLTAGEVNKIWNSSMEDFQIPRGYLSKEDKEFLGIKEDF